MPMMLLPLRPLRYADYVDASAFDVISRFAATTLLRHDAMPRRLRSLIDDAARCLLPMPALLAAAT